MLKTILNQVKEFKIPSILAPFFMVLEVICELIIPLMMGFIIDRGINSSNLNAVFMYGGLMLVCAFGALLFGSASAHYGSYAASGLAKNLRSSMFKKIQSFSFKNIERQLQEKISQIQVTQVKEVMKKLGIEVNIDEERMRRFPRFAQEIQGNSMRLYYNDGSINGKLILSSETVYKEEEGKVGIETIFTQHI